jgi:hypothetical protein
MKKEQKEAINKFIKKIAKAEAFVPEKMLPEELSISENRTGSIAMISITKILREWRELYKTLETNKGL